MVHLFLDRCLSMDGGFLEKFTFVFYIHQCCPINRKEEFDKSANPIGNLQVLLEVELKLCTKALICHCYNHTGRALVFSTFQDRK